MNWMRTRAISGTAAGWPRTNPSRCATRASRCSPRRSVSGRSGYGTSRAGSQDGAGQRGGPWACCSLRIGMANGWGWTNPAGPRPRRRCLAMRSGSGSPKGSRRRMRRSARGISAAQSPSQPNAPLSRQPCSSRPIMAAISSSMARRSAGQAIFTRRLNST